MKESISNENSISDLGVSNYEEKLSQLEIKNALLEKELKEKEKQINIMLKNISIICHDIKGPIGSIVGLTEIMIEDIKEGRSNKEETIEQCKIIGETCSKSTNLVTDFFTLTMLQKDNINPEVFVTQLKDRVDDQLSLLFVSADLKNISLINNIKDDIKIMANENMLNMAIRNLVSNAIKFTKEGGEVSVSSYTENDQTVIAVKDNGVGLESDILNNIFNNGGETTPGTNGEKGTGFGLQICKEMIERMGGTIEAQSEGLDMGTTFIIKLPSA